MAYLKTLYLLATNVLATALIVVTCFSAATLQAQMPKKHFQLSGNMAPGVAADISRLANPALSTHMQPVQVIVPKLSSIEVGMDEGYVQVNASKVSVGMFVGPVYRFKVTGIAQNFGKDLYPSIEILDKLNPPKGMENDFPVQVVITQDDLLQALNGNMVTKVIYLEDPDGAFPQKHLPDQQPSFDIGGSEDPMSAARSMGRPMAILRMGSRIPMANDKADFNFRSPEPQFLPAPQAMGQNPKWEDPIELPPIRLPNQVPQLVPDQIVPLGSRFNQVPPIVQGGNGPATLYSARANPTFASPSEIGTGQIRPEQPQRFTPVGDSSIISAGQSILKR
jgi:hypothetical protein